MLFGMGTLVNTLGPFTTVNSASAPGPGPTASSYSMTEVVTITMPASTPAPRLYGFDDSLTVVPAIPPGTTIITGDTATIGFWHNKNGQDVIDSFNGGSTETTLGNWLAGKFGNLFGTSNPYIGTSLAGLTNAQVAADYLNLWPPSGVTKNDYVQLFAGALACYATSTTLGYDSTAGKYGFNSSTGGTCNKMYNVGSNGAAFGVPNGTILTVLEVLEIANANFNPSTGLFYGGNQSLTSALNNVINGINSTGDIS